MNLQGFLFLNVPVLITPIQVLAARNAACRYLEQELHGPTPFCYDSGRGILHFVKTEPFGAFSGDYFFAHFGGGHRLDFFLCRGAREIPMPSRLELFVRTYMPAPQVPAKETQPSPRQRRDKRRSKRQDGLETYVGTPKRTNAPTSNKFH